MKINTLKRSVALAMGLGLAGAVTPLATLAQPPVDDPTEHLLEIGQNEDTMEDTDIAGPPLDPRANILGYPTPLGPDWSDLFRADHGYKDVNPANGIPDYKDYGAIIATFVRDDLVGESISTSPKIIGDRTIFSGSNKNNEPINTYEWKGGSVPAKDDVSNGYFMADRNGDGDLIIYGGFERIANNGDSHIDIEFNQSEIGLTINGVAVDPALMSDPSWQGCPKNATCVFTGARQAGDILVSMDFLRGGDFGTAEIHVWQGDAATGSWTSVHALDGEGCNPANTYPAGAICAFNNNDDIDGGPWENFDSHGAVTTLIPRNGFTEGGMNVSKLVGGGTIPCISSVTVKTRSSQSFTAELKDFVLGSFEVCGQLTVVKQATGQDGTPTFNYSGTGGVGSFSLSPAISGGTGSASTSFDQVSPGPITITETDASGFASGTNANCVYSGTATTVPGGTYQPNSVSFPLDTGDDITCTFYNTQPTLKVTKTVTSCATETSTFGLYIDGALKATVSKPGGNTGQHYVSFGTQHSAGEVISGTNEIDWVTAIDADCDSNGFVTTSALQAYECTISNVRKPRVIVNKAICDGTSCTQSSTGFTLQVNGNTVSAGTAVNIEQVGGVFPATVSEVRGAGTYLTTIMCNNGTRGVYDASTTPSLNLGNLQAGDVVTCDIVNAKQTSQNACPTP